MLQHYLGHISSQERHYLSQTTVDMLIANVNGFIKEGPDFLAQSRELFKNFHHYRQVLLNLKKT
jgi:hypothetical protein